MAARAKGVTTPDLDQLDDFDTYLEKAKASPSFRVGYEDEHELHRLLDSLVALRKALGLNQTAVAHRMGVRQPTISGFETEASDPRVSTLQRYARAVEARLRFVIEMPADYDWVSRSVSTYGSSANRTNSAPRAAVRSGNLARRWDRRTDYERAA
jgi:transcriptional regulator with XRE-family HTH domain